MFKKGDIIAYYSKEVIGELITDFTFGPSHVGMVVNETTTIEALTGGIKLCNINAKLKEKSNKAVYLYSLDEDVRDKLIMTRLGMFEKVYSSYIDKKYSYTSAFLAFLNTYIPFLDVNVKGNCCSSLIMEIYQKLGYHLKSSPDTYTPYEVTKLNIINEVKRIK